MNHELEWRVIEAIKSLDLALKEKGFPGKSFPERLSLAERFLPNYRLVEKIADKRDEILASNDYELDEKTATEDEQTIAYALAQISRLKKLGAVRRVRIKLRDKAESIGIQKAVLSFALFVALVIFLSRTALGQNIVNDFLNFVDLLVSGILIFGALILVTFASFAYLEKKRRGQSESSEPRV